MTQLYTKGNTRIYVTPIEANDRLNRRERERATEQHLLQEIFGVDVVLSHSSNGAPYIAGNSTHISISHSRHHLCIAVSTEKAIGIDIEELQERIMRLYTRFLSADELEDLTPNVHNLTLCWCAKEAIYKIAGDKAGAIGEHIRIDTKGIDIGKDFHAQIGDEIYRFSLVADMPEYLIVIAEHP
ncbi:MAG: 4'-phosphopantetheinyl transferase superfamily protein [Paludibacter sp.]|nr:4'-phosphopantetheinyl transferase superfamily protein [Bacteroidales bacterium]MCM1069419.1 4'-phosphopantetheinyl transferase superfamily protein [Prevotella sp.]MCM1353794.1 4'-phosphopantetheinyl transferase superfamily protein [Bacteroides sp.]MCM1442805.1 4'-phosphopantetheinyl transferase superfamily protein [Muribaculum sp.]MCM1481829.1 4'-phosphopantetheinyl transferase superfamily protein [Paludibacter sp.]